MTGLPLIEQKFLIHATPAGRSGLLGAWLTDTCTKVAFDVGKEVEPRVIRIHDIDNSSQLTCFNGIKIRIQPTIEHVDLLSLLLTRKHKLELNDSEYDLTAFTRLYKFAKNMLINDSQLDYSLYNYTIKFEDTFNTNAMIDIYSQIKNCMPSNIMIETLEKINQLNKIPIEKNHVCSILKMILIRESELGLDEQQRHWSIVDIYNQTPINQLYNSIYNAIVPENYGHLLP